MLLNKITPEMLDQVSDQGAKYFYADWLVGAQASIKSVPEDFVVEEIPLYPLSGSGEHTYLWIEKRGLATGALIDLLCRHLGISHRDIGYAGKKDAEAISRQWISVPGKAWKGEISGESFKVLEQTRHGNKLRVGHLMGNRFSIRLRDITGVTPSVLKERLEARSMDGFWNTFGPQRFGARARSLNMALKWIDGGCRPLRDRRHSPGFLASVWQSAVFNWCVGLRQKAQRGMVLSEGDVPVYTRLRFAGQEGLPDPQVPSGPLWGERMRNASGDVHAYEHLALADWSTDQTTLELVGRWQPGTRRPMVAFPENLVVETLSDGGLQVQFSLPAGCYATAFLGAVLWVADRSESD